MNMAFQKLGNVHLVVDNNGQQVDGRVEDVMGLGPLDRKFEAFGATVVRVDGHDLAAIDNAFRTPHEGKPLVVVADTQPTRGLKLLGERFPSLHYVRFKSDLEQARYADALAEMA